MSTIPRSEYPRPQFFREDWQNLNGVWTYEFDFGGSGIERGLASSKGFDSEITVPFCPESELSGVAHKDFIQHIFYHRKLFIPEAWAGKRIFINFGAVDYACAGYLDGKQVGSHFGGSSSFAFDLTEVARPGSEQDFVLAVNDLQRSGEQMEGKQCFVYKSLGCHYTRTTGIWQTVWLEAVDRLGLKKCQITPDLDGKCFSFRPFFYEEKPGRLLQIRILAEGKEAGSAIVAGNTGMNAVVPVNMVRSWCPADPFLYDIEYTVISDGRVVDTVTAYAGLRKIHIEGDKIFLNNSPLFLRLVLDQGFYRKGIWTAPSDEDLKRDIQLSMAAGFNGARLHQKVFEERFHYWADKLGYLTWGECPSWGAKCFGGVSGQDVIALRAMMNFIHEWKELVQRDYNHPSIIAWTPANETWPTDMDFYTKMMEEIYDITKLADPTRPCNETSGYHHVKTDLWTTHFYRKNAEELLQAMKPEDFPVGCQTPKLERPAYHGQPYINDEFGGFLYLPADLAKRFADNTWGYYGLEIKSDDEFAQKIAEQVKVMVDMPECSGFCYTQLTDVEQEQNGVYTYDRVPKIPVEKLHQAFSYGNR